MGASWECQMVGQVWGGVLGGMHVLCTHCNEPVETLTSVPEPWSCNELLSKLCNSRPIPRKQVAAS
jgi:hypothetical protein